MGTSTNGMIGFGWMFEEGIEFPWYDEADWDYGVEDWWRKINGFIASDGDYDAQLDKKRTWDKANPCPITIENYSSDGCPMYAIIITRTLLTCWRGHPTTFNPRDLRVDKAKVEEITVLLREHHIELEEPSWLLMSYWGQS